MVALMFIYSICAPIILSSLNKEDTFYPVSLTKEYSPTTLVTSNRINWLQFYRWGSLKPTASAYNMAYTATILWMIMLLSKSVMDCSITATEQYINLTELLKRRFIVSLLNAYQQSMGVTYLSIIPLFSFWLLTKVSHGSLLSYYWVMNDEKFRKDNAGNFKQLCSQEDETINWPADKSFSIGITHFLIIR